MEILATYNIKGGVGKTATAVNLSYLSALEGARTLVWDMDPQGAATFYFRIRPKVKGGAKKLIRGSRVLDPLLRGTDFENLDLLPADFSYRHLDLVLDDTKKPMTRLRKVLRPLADEYDRVFLDCAPSISLTSESVFATADALLVPTIPTTLSLLMLKKLKKHLKKTGMKSLDVLPFFCMADRRKSLHRSIADPSEPAPFSFLHTQIPYSSLVEQMGVHRAPLSTYARWSAPSRAYERLWQEIRARLDGETCAPRDSMPTQYDETTEATITEKEGTP